MDGDRQDQVSRRFTRLLVPYRRPDGSKWGGQDLETATNGVVERSYVTNLRKGRISSPGLDRLEAIAGAMGFPPQLWFGDVDHKHVSEAALEDETVRAILEEALRLEPRDKQLLLGIARQFASSVGG
jgi:transcriptional regulator with XRE-family HTH domain